MSKSLQASSKLIKFAPLIDDQGLLRVGGRLQMSTWPFDRRHTILLGKHYLTELLIRHYHQERKHQGVEALLAFLHQHFWIINGRRIVRKVKEACVKCRRYDAMACNEVTAPLPHERVVYGRPFYNYFCDVDYAGPLLAKVQQSKCKLWLILFVCGTTRAILLEVVTSLAFEEFALAFRRFVARRSYPDRIMSDNAATFKAAAKSINVQ